MDDIYVRYNNAVKGYLSGSSSVVNFKKDPNYTYMLEHVDYNKGREYLNCIISNFNGFFTANKAHLIGLCSMNDMIGNPNKYDYEGFTSCSPTNLRYLYQTLLILKFVKENNIDAIDFIEIGGGYGGLCFYIHKVSELLDIKVSSYTIFDLKEVCEFQKKYLQSLKINVNTAQLDSEYDLRSDSFLISNYAFSEISRPLQDLYKKDILDVYISFGFLCWNNIDLYDFIDNKNIIAEEELPKTGPKNKYVYISPNK